MADDTPAEPAASAARAGESDKSNQPYQTAAEMLGIEGPKGERDPRLSQSPDLTRIEGSQVPGYGDGRMVHHVMGPGQAPVDPVAAGLDLYFNPKIRHDLRAPTETGVLGAGNRPSTYAEKPGGTEIKQSTEESNKTVKPMVPAAAPSTSEPAAKAPPTPATKPADTAPKPAAAQAPPVVATKPAAS